MAIASCFTQQKVRSRLRQIRWVFRRQSNLWPGSDRPLTRVSAAWLTNFSVTPRWLPAPDHGGLSVSTAAGSSDLLEAAHCCQSHGPAVGVTRFVEPECIPRQSLNLQALSTDWTQNLCWVYLWGNVLLHGTCWSFHWWLYIGIASQRSSPLQLFAVTFHCWQGVDVWHEECMKGTAAPSSTFTFCFSRRTWVS